MALFSLLIKRNVPSELEILVKALFDGERLAARISSVQAKHFKQTNANFYQFFKRQSKQESFHAKLFKSTLLWLNPKSALSEKTSQPFVEIEEQIRKSLRYGCADESVLALQVIIESLGESALKDLNSSLDEFSIGLRRVRELVLFQESLHQAFGQEYFSRRAYSEQKITSMFTIAGHYQEKILPIFDNLTPALESMNICTAHYQITISNDIRQALSRASKTGKFLGHKKKMLETEHHSKPALPSSVV